MRAWPQIKANRLTVFNWRPVNGRCIIVHYKGGEQSNRWSRFWSIEVSPDFSHLRRFLRLQRPHRHVFYEASILFDENVSILFYLWFIGMHFKWAKPGPHCMQCVLSQAHEKTKSMRVGWSTIRWKSYLCEWGFWYEKGCKEKRDSSWMKIGSHWTVTSTPYWLHKCLLACFQILYFPIAIFFFKLM